MSGDSENSLTLERLLRRIERIERNMELRIYAIEQRVSRIEDKLGMHLI